MMIIDKIKKMLGYNILTLGQNKETDIDDYDIALIKLCKMFRININNFLQIILLILLRFHIIHTIIVKSY